MRSFYIYGGTRKFENITLDVSVITIKKCKELRYPRLYKFQKPKMLKHTSEVTFRAGTG